MLEMIAAGLLIAGTVLVFAQLTGAECDLARRLAGPRR